MLVKLRRLSNDAIIPSKATQGSAGFDLYASEDITALPKCTVLVRTDIAVELPEGYEAQIRSRSGLAKRDVIVANSPGTIDSDYRGPVGVLIKNHSSKEFVIEKGDRIAQMVVQQVPDVYFEEVYDLTNTDRGAGGFGSSGV